MVIFAVEIKSSSSRKRKLIDMFAKLTRHQANKGAHHTERQR